MLYQINGDLRERRTGMKVKKLKSCFCLLLVLMILNISIRFVYIDASTVNISRCQQLESKWCWAACAQMLGKYYGNNVSQPDIVKAVKGKRVNEGGEPHEVVSAIKYAARRDSAYAGMIPFAGMERELYYGKPFVIRMQWNTGGGHVLVVSGTYPSSAGLDKVRLVDPAQGCSTATYSFNALVNGTKIQSGTGHYSHTFLTGSMLSTK